MDDMRRTKAELIQELQQLRARVENHDAGKPVQRQGDAESIRCDA